MTMERKIGEIFDYNGEWYQCVEELSWGVHCNGCDFIGIICSKLNPKCSPAHYRSDGKSVIFKKLEKVGVPYPLYGHIVQRYTGVKFPVALTEKRFINCNEINNTIDIEVKQQNQNKEDMEEKKLNLKPFDIQKAREGKPVCTRDGRKARIICFDRRLFYKNVSYPILALVECSDGEDDVCGYNEKGKVLIEDGAEYKDDLMMLPEKKEGWVNVDKRSNGDVIISKPYPTRDEAIHNSTELTIDTVNIEWEE